MKLETKHYYDDETMEFIAAKWFVDGEEVSFDEYMDIVDGLEEYNKDENDVEEDNDGSNECDNCDEVVCDDCEECEIPEDTCRDIGIIEEYADKIENGDMCPVCLRNTLYDLYVEGKNVGWDDYKDYIQECIDTSVSD